MFLLNSQSKRNISKIKQRNHSQLKDQENSPEGTNNEIDLFSLIDTNFKNEVMKILKELRKHSKHSVSHLVVSDSATPWTVAHQTPLFIEFSRQAYWSGLPWPSTGDLPDPGIKLRSLAVQAYALSSELPEKPKERNYER